MTFSDWSNNNKKKKKSDDSVSDAKEYGSFADWSNAKHGATVQTTVDDDIAPVKGGNKDSWFKSGGFSDGVTDVGDFFGDLGETLLGSVGDLGLNVLKGAGRLVEGVLDAGTYAVANSIEEGKEMAEWITGKKSSVGDSIVKSVRDFGKKNLTDDLSKPATDFVDEYSVFGNKADMIGEGLGQVGAIILTGGAAGAAGMGTAGVTALTTGLTGISGMGSGASEAYNAGATNEEAALYGLITGAAEAGTELLFGGLGKASKAIGIGKSAIPVDDLLAKKVSGVFKGTLMKNLTEWGIKSSAEGAEEVLSGFIQAIGKNATYMSEKELGDILADENLLEQFIVGAVTSGIAQSGIVPGMTDGSLIKSTAQGKDFVTGQTKNEQAVIKAEVENRVAEKEKNGKKLTKKEIAEIEERVTKDLEKGYISIDTIESTLGGESFKGWKQHESAIKQTESEIEQIKKEITELEATPKYEITVGQDNRLTQLRTQLEERQAQLKNQQAQLPDFETRAHEEVDKLTANDALLRESYNERARRGQAFTVDLNKYTGAQKAAYERAVKSGVLNNTNRSHELVDTLSKIEADKGITFDYANNAKLKESGFAIGGKTVNGFVNTKTGNVTLNVQSNQAWQSTVGHEVTHVLEGTEAYTELQKALFAYAESKGELEGRRAHLAEIYGDMNADIDSELTADLVGDYLFTDEDFVNKLTGNRTLFQKVWDEIKYLCKVATGKELTEIEKVERAFAKAWKERDSKSFVSESADGETENVKYSIRKEAPPKETGIAYKVFFVKDGKLYPPMVANPDGADTPIGVWLNADVGASAPPSKTGRAQVKAGGKGTQGGSGSLAFRPGWHLGDLPRASQFDRVNPETGKKELFPENFVWAEVEYAKDVDYQEEAMSYGYTENGKFRHAYAGLPKLPENGYYRYRTNPRPDTVPWVITGAMKVNRLLSDAEVNAILEENGVPAVHRQGGDVGLDKFGFDEGGQVKYSISGKNAKTANASLLAKAESMLAEGVDSETVRQETGWYKGYDGKMRFEIDDSDMEFNIRGHFTNPDVVRYKELENKLLTDPEKFTDAEEKELRSLSAALKGVKKTPKNLGDYIKHDKLFEAYPQLKDIRLRFNYLPDGTMGAYNADQNEILLNYKIKDSENKIVETLVHEIQHAIQGIERFASGASVEYWQNRRQDIADTIKGARENLDLWLDDIGYNDFAKASARKLANKEKTLDQHWKDLEEFKKNSKYAKQIAACEAELAEFQKQYDEITNGMTAFEQYQNTAGEIEARDAENRLNLTAEERRSKRPDIDRDNVVFADRGVRYSVSSDADYAKAVESGDTALAQTMVDEAAKNAGYSIKAYHGTGYDFTVFDKSKQGDNYKDWGRLGKGFYFAPTAREAETWAELSRGVKNKVMPVYLKSENMLDSFEALPDNLKDTIPADWDSLTRRLAEKYAYNYIEYMQEFGYDVQEILKSKGYDGINGHVEYVLYDPEQVKSADPITYDDKGNVIPLSERFNTANEDIRFSLSKSVEETKDLVAVHNLHASELMKTLELGGLPMPSIAVIKAEQGHEEYGDVSLIFPKDTIDPKQNKANKVYGGDAWTPSYPKLEYKVNESAQKTIRDKIESLVPYEARNKLGHLSLDYDNLSDAINRSNGDVVDAYGNNRAMKYAFLRDTGFSEQLPMREERLDGMGKFDNSFIIKVANELGDSEIKRLNSEGFANNEALISDLREMANADFLEKLNGHGELLESFRANPAYTEKNFGFAQADRIIRAAHRYLQNGVGQTVDYSAANDVIDNAVDQGAYENWLKDTFADIVEKEGIRNNAEFFTPSGNRRKWEALHWENTLENVIKVMKAQIQTGDGFFAANSLFGVANKNYKSISDIKADASRLQTIPEEEYAALKESFTSRLTDIADSIKDPRNRNSYIALDNAIESIVDAVRNRKTKTGILTYMQKWNDRVTAETVDEIVSLVSDIANMPTGYFEAKPQRAVGLEEVGVFVIPNNTDVKLKQELLNKGYNIAEYDPNIEGDRTRVVNNFEELKFSLSDANAPFAPTGDYATPLSDLAFDAPVAETISKTETVANNTAETMPDDYAPATAEEVDALNRESFAHLSDDDAPPVRTQYNDTVADAISIDNKSLKGLSKNISEELGLNRAAKKELEQLMQTFSKDEFATKDDLYDAIAKKFGTQYDEIRHEDIEIAKAHIHNTKIYVSQVEKGEIGSAKDYNAFMRKNFGKIRFSKDGASVDRVYMELNELYPHLFPDDIVNTGDQLMRIAEVANESVTELIPTKLPNAMLKNATDMIYDSITEYKESERMLLAEEALDAPIDESLAPPTTAAEQEAEAEQTASKQAAAEVVSQIADGTRSEDLLRESLDNYPMQTVEQKVAEKLRAVEANIADNKALRRDAEANYDRQIAQLREKYSAHKNKNTKAAYSILQSISRLERLKASAEADYAKRISDLEERAERMKTPAYSRAMHKQAKMQEHADWAADLLGDTTNWKDKKLGMQYATNTERRNLRDIVRDENGNHDIARADAIDDALNGQHNREEADKKREIAKVRSKYADMKITKAEDAYIQMLGEFRHNPDTTLTEKAVKEYYEKHKNKIDVNKVDKVIELARKDYDDFLNRVNAELRNQGMKEIPYRKGYFPHFTDTKQNFIQKLFNWKTQDDEIPTSIAGLTETFKPVRTYQSFDKQRHSDETDFSFTKGFDTYTQGVLDWIYHLDTLQKRRAVENHIRYTHSEEGIKARIKEVYANEEIDANEAQAQIEHILSEAKNPLNNFVQDFTTRTNILAGKKNSLDRAVEQATNRHIYSIMTNVQNRLSANMVAANVRSALTNFIPITQSWAQVSPLRSLQAAKDTIANAIKDDGTIEKSTFLTNRLREPDNLYKTGWDKIIDTAGVMFDVVDSFSSQVVWRAKYIDNIHKGMNEAQAIKNADQFAENVMAGRSKGNEPTLFNAKNPFIKAFTAFQLEVNNQYGYLFKDVPNDLKAETKHWKLNMAKGLTTAFVGAYVYNALLEQITGSDAALDPLGIIEELLRDLGMFDDEEEKEPAEIATNLANNVLEELPFVGGLLGGGRIPISSALPYSDDGLNGFIEDVAEGDWGSVGKEMLNPLYNLALPVGGGQIKKTAQGLNMFSDEHPVAGSYTDSGNLRFPVEDTPLNRLQAGIFGQYASENAREYFDNGYAPLKEKQIQEYIDVDMPIKDYWKYRKGLAKQETLEDKLDYISGLDLPTSKKNILANNVTDRKNPINLADWDDYSGLEEFDFAANNPEKYQLSRVVGGYNSYKAYSEDLYDIKADKNAEGKSISGSRKKKVVEYINNLDASYETKIILFKSEYPADDTYNVEIVNYINSRNDLTYDERIAIFTELGFTVSNGNVYW